MKPAAWRVSILVLCGITGLAVLAELFGATGIDGASPWLGIWGRNGLGFLAAV
jgi:cell division protein FtsW (lipid II flippase)